MSATRFPWYVAVIVAASIGLLAATPFPQRCTGGRADGMACAADSDCDGGFCVRAGAVCDGGGADRFDCPCPGGACTRALSCASDPELGTCSGGERDGACCEPLRACDQEGACTATARVCDAGEERGFGCLRDAHCPGGACGALARVCRGGLFAGAPCADGRDCRGGICLGQSGPVGCGGDCDASGEVTVDEVVTLVNVGLGSASVGACAAGDTDADGAVTVDEIITAVSAALGGCPPLP